MIEKARDLKLIHLVVAQLGRVDSPAPITEEA